MRFKGLPVSEGTATGSLYLADVGTSVSATPREVRDAFAAVTAQRFALAERLRSAGRDAEAAIGEIGAFIAADPVLAGPAVAAVRDGTDAATAVLQATEAQAAVLAALPIPNWPSGRATSARSRTRFSASSARSPSCGPPVISSWSARR